MKNKPYRKDIKKGQNRKISNTVNHQTHTDNANAKNGKIST
jgi:hypothetical protein